MLIYNDKLHLGEKKIALVVNAKQLYLKLWSNRLMLIAALLSGLEAAYQVYLGGEPWIAGMTFLISFSATIARMIPQPQAIEKAAVKAEEIKEEKRNADTSI